MIADLQNRTRNTGEAAGDSYNLVENLADSRFADELWGDGKANTLWGKDTLYLGGDSDIVIFGRGDDHDTVAADGFNADSTNKALFSDHIESDDLWFENSGGDLEISVVGAEDSLTLKGWFGAASPAGRMDEFHLSSGEILIESRVHALVTAMAQATARGSRSGGLGRTAERRSRVQVVQSALDTAWQSPVSGCREGRRGAGHGALVSGAAAALPRDGGGPGATGA